MRRGKLMGTEERKGLVGREKVQRLGCNDRPPDYIVAQINRPFGVQL